MTHNVIKKLLVFQDAITLLNYKNNNVKKATKNSEGDPTTHNC